MMNRVVTPALGKECTFDVDEFMAYIKKEFPEPMEYHFTYDMLKNLLSFLFEEDYSIVQIANILHRIIPVEVEEILQFYKSK